MSREIEAVAAAWDASFNAGDTARLAKFYAADAGVVPAGGSRMEGPAAIAAFFADLQAKGFKDHKIAVASVREQGETAIATGTWQLRGPGGDGTVTAYGGNWVNVLVQSGGAWQIALHTWN